MALIPAEIKMQGNDNAWFTANAAIVFADNIQIFHNDGRYKFTDGVTALSALPFLGGSSQTLQQVLTNNPSTGGADIISPDTFSVLKANNGTASIQYSDGVVFGSVEATPLQNTIQHDLKVSISAPLITVSQNPTTALGIVTKQYADTKEPAIAATTSADFFSGAKTFINFATTVRASVLTGLSLISSTVISATDSVLVALGRLQAQITLRELLANKSDSFTASSSTTYSSTKALVDGLATKGSGTILGTLGTTGTGSQIPYNSGVANTVVGSDNFTMYNVGINTAIIMKNPSVNGIQELDFYDGSSVSGVAYYGNGYTATQFQGTAISKAQALNIFAGNNFQLPIVFSGTPVVSLAGNTGTNAGTRLDIIGFRIGTLADANTANTARLEIVAGTNTIPLIKLNSSSPIATLTNGTVEYDSTNLTLTAKGTRQNILKGLSGSFSGTGTATVAFTVTFGNTQPNTTYQVNITPTNALTAAVLYVTSKTTTTFTVTFLTGLTGTVAFDWVLLQ